MMDTPMDKDLMSQEDKRHFSTHSSLFLKSFEEEFTGYFANLCVNYDRAVSKEDAQEIAVSIYHGVFKCDGDIGELKEDLLIRMRQDGVMVGFLINRSMLYLIEKYIEFSKAHAIEPRVELLVACIGRFVNLLENDISPQVRPTNTVLDISFSNDVMFTPTNNIIDIFHRLKEEHHPIVFLNLYKGVPISSEGEIVEIEGENVTFKIDRLQEIAMKLDAQAFIVKNDSFSKHLKADIVNSNFHDNTIVLSNFTYLLNMPALQREFIRVHPDIIAKVYLHQFGNLQTSGRLYDLSMNGLGVVSSENNGVFVGAKVLIEFELNSATIPMEGNKKIEVQGEVINIIEYKDSFRYCMRIDPDREMSEKILRYITAREKEILEDLNHELDG
jgi:hypothetical protein